MKNVKETPATDFQSVEVQTMPETWQEALELICQKVEKIAAKDPQQLADNLAIFALDFEMWNKRQAATEDRINEAIVNLVALCDISQTRELFFDMSINFVSNEDNMISDLKVTQIMGMFNIINRL